MALLLCQSHVVRREFMNLFTAPQKIIKINEMVTAKKFNTSSKLLLTLNLYKRKLKLSSAVRIIGIGCAVGTLASAGYLYDMYKKVSAGPPILNDTNISQYFLREAPPTYPAARSIVNTSDKSGLKITLYQYQTCPFCCKVRAFLDYYGFSYDVIEVNSITHKQTKWTTYRKVPFLVVEQEGVETVMQLKDSTMIISALQSFIFNNSRKLEDHLQGYPVVASKDENGKVVNEIMNRYSVFYGVEDVGKNKEEIILERQWRQWADDVYVHMLSPNAYRTMSEALQAFNWFSEVGDWKTQFKMWERYLVIYLGSAVMYLIGKRLKKRHHLKNDVRESFYDETNLWLKQIKSKGKFLGGSEPNLGDLAVYGVLTAVEGCDTFNDILDNTNVHKWFEEMRMAVQAHEGSRYLAVRGNN